MVVGRSPVSGGLQSILDAWDRYQSDADQPGGDRAASLTALEDELRRVADNRDRSSYRGAQLLDYLRTKTGVDPLPGDRDPVVEYAQLRTDANQAVHVASSLDAATALYDRTVAWLIRMFTPPDAVVHGLSELAKEAWRGLEQIDKLRELATNPHHLRLFFGRVADAAWLTPLYEAKLLQLPDPELPWPPSGLLDGLGRSSPTEVAGLFERMLTDSKRLPSEQLAGVRFELLRVATHLGAAGHQVVAGVAALHPNVHAVRALAVGVVKRADPADPVVQKVADAVLSGEPLDRDSYYADVVDRLEAGLDASNVADRSRMLAAKVRRLARNPHTRFVALDIARLTADLGDERDYLSKTTHSLARLLTRARELGVPTADLLTWTANTPGEVGERITCRILAEAGDVALKDKITHIARRLASSTATGDDRDLIDSVLSNDPQREMLEAWSSALGTPSPRLQNARSVPEDWARAWRWSVVLPDVVLAKWQEPIAQVTARYGPPDQQALDRRSELPQMLTGQSAYSEEELASLPVQEAAELVAVWRPDETSDRRLVGARELARSLEAVAKADPDAWSSDPVAVVKALREPVYVLHYLRALTDNAADTAPRASTILDAAALVRTARWEPTILGRDDFDFEPDWRNVDTATLDLIAALANTDADLTSHLDVAWTWALDSIDRARETDESGSSFEGFDALNRAINQPRGRALKAVLALGGWEHRTAGTIPTEFVNVLDDVIRIPGPVGMDYRAILAEQRLFLESVATAWLEQNAPTLFSDDEAGRETFDLTLKYSRPTRWFYRRFRDQLFAAALRRAHHAIAWLLVAALRGEDRYELHMIIEGLRGNTAVLASAANEMAFLVQTSESDSPHLATAVEFWRALLEADRRVVPADALRSSGRWAFVTGLPDEGWSQLTLQTLEITDGNIDLPIEVADRCKTSLTSGNSNRILLSLLGHGEPWEQHYVAEAAIEKLRSQPPDSADETFWLLRTRLIELGRHEATEILPETNNDNG